MRRMLADGVDLYELVVDDEGPALAHTAPVTFLDEEEALRWLWRVGDDYSERLALRQVLARLTGHDELCRISEEELVHQLARLLCAGALRVRKLVRQA